MNTISIDWRRVIIIAGLIFFVLVIVDFNSRLERLERLNRQADITRAEATHVEWTKIAFETKVANADSDQMVEELARSEGHMIKEGDHAVTILGDEGAPALEKLNSTPVPTAKPNWQLWWDLYFGE